MSEYDYERRRSRNRRRSTRTREPEYIETDETLIARGPGYRQDLVLRQRDRDDDFDDRRSYVSDYSRRARSQGYPDRNRDYENESTYSDYSRRRSDRRSRYDDEESYYSGDDRRRERRKSRVGEAIEGLGLGGIVAAVTGKADRSKSRRRRSGGNDRSSSRGGRRSPSRENLRKWQQAAKAAAVTGVIEAVRSRKDPQKMQRIATAALSAAGIDGFLDRDPDSKSKRHIIESVVGGLAANRLANGPRDSDDTRGRSRSRSRSRGGSFVERIRSRSQSMLSRGRSASRGPNDGVSRSGSAVGNLKSLAAVGGVAAVGKAIYDRVRSKSRGRLPRRSRSASSDDSYVPSRRQRYNQKRERDERDDGDDRSRGFDDRDDDRNDDDGQRGQMTERNADGEGQRARDRSSSTSSISTTDLEKRRRKMRGKELLTAGLATVATIHAAHGVYSSMMASEKRRKLVGEGEMSPEEARKRKSKNILQDVAAVGIAALGIKSAYGEWKEVQESRKEKHEIDERKRRRAKAREKKLEEDAHKLQGGWGGHDGGAMSPNYPDANPYGAYGGMTYPGGYGASIPPPPGNGPPR
jgi:hypothetical protein